MKRAEKQKKNANKIDTTNRRRKKKKIHSHLTCAPPLALTQTQYTFIHIIPRHEIVYEQMHSAHSFRCAHIFSQWANSFACCSNNEQRIQIEIYFLIIALGKHTHTLEQSLHQFLCTAETCKIGVESG